MAYRKLFGQYYDSAKAKSQDVSYICSSESDAASNTISFDDGKVVLTDSNGDTLHSLDLSSVLVRPVSQWASNSIILNPGEVKFLTGLEYGRSLKSMYFRLPKEILPNIETVDNWKDFLSLEFDILYTENLQLEDYHVKVSMLPGTDRDTLTLRIDNILSDMGIPVTTEWMTDEEETYLAFKSELPGYDFSISNVLLGFLLSDEGYEYSPYDGIYEYVDEEGQSVEISYLVRDEDGNLLSDADGNYMDELGDKVSKVLRFVVSKAGLTKAELKVIEDAEGDIKSIWDRINSMTTSYGTYDREALRSLAMLFHYDGGEDQNDGSEDTEDIEKFRVPADIIPVSMPEMKDMLVPAYKYPNGAARCWFIVPEWPSSENEDFTDGIWLNHVHDKVAIYERNAEHEGCYVRNVFDVIGYEKNEKERRNIRNFYVSANLEEYTDKYGTVIRKNVTEETPSKCECSDEACRCNILTEKQEHIGMFRYIDWASENDLWEKIGLFYSIISPDDDETDTECNMSRSVYLFNPNDYPIKVNYFIAV